MGAIQLLKSIQLGFILDQPGYGVLSYKLKPVVKPDCPTACTDGKMIAINEEFFSGLSIPHQKFIYAHELLHCAFLHPLRRGIRDAMLWNMACDYAVNIHLSDARFSVPHGALIDEKYRGMPVERIYEDLTSNPNKVKSAEKGWNVGGVEDPKESQEGMADLEQEWRITSVQAANAQKQFGETAGVWEGLIAAVTQRKLGFEGYLYKYMSFTSRDDYNWARFNKRKALLGLQLPGMFNHSLGDLAIAIDTSGSVDDVKLGKFLGKIEIMRSQFPCKIHVFLCDTKVTAYKVFEKHEKLDVKVYGRGGTDFVPVFNMLNEKRITPAALLYFTDMEGKFPAKAPYYPVLWVVYNSEKLKAPFGDVVYFND